jgi:Baseplate J-like protein
MLTHSGEKFRMNDFEIKCDSESRRKLFLNNALGLSNSNLDTINGIDYIEVRRVDPDIQKNSNNSDSDTDLGLEVSSSERTTILLLLFLYKEPTPNTINEKNVRILGGTRIKDIRIALAGRADDVKEKLNDKEKDIINKLDASKTKKLIIVRPTKEGDFSVYKLKLVSKDKPEEALTNFDPIFSQIDFSFKIDCALDFDCKVDTTCAPVSFEEPSLDYMAKDYASFVKLIQSRFNQIIPEWKEKSAADLTIVLIELLSYIGDHLSYYQDSVSTEAYLGTARKRISIKRHVRLLDYFIDEGSNARMWVCFKIKPSNDEDLEGHILKKFTKVLTGEPTKDKKNSLSVWISGDELQEILSQQTTIVFETMHDVRLYASHNEMFFYTWGETDCCLPKGATHATLLRDRKINGIIMSLDLYIFSWGTVLTNKQDQNNLKNFIIRISSVFHDRDSINIVMENNVTLKMVDSDDTSKFITIKLEDESSVAKAEDKNSNLVYEFLAKKISGETQIYGLSLNQGDVLILEEILSPTTLKDTDRDPTHRQAVKLTYVKPKFDPIKDDVNLVEIYWHEEDALRFPLCINKIESSNITANTGNKVTTDPPRVISIARGNVALVDHGYTIKNEELDNVPERGIYYPRLAKSPLTFAPLFTRSDSAYSSIYSQRLGDFLHPEILIIEGNANTVSKNDVNCQEDKTEMHENKGINCWYPKRDLLSSDKFAKEFVVEIDNDGTAYLRFGDGINGQKPSSTTNDGNIENPVKFYATYRIGNGSIGNVGSRTIKRIVKDPDNQDFVEKIQTIYNPLPAIGGTDQESLDEVRQRAPVAFMKQERAVTEEDYASVLRRHPEVQRAVAMFRWTGSWYTVYVTIDRIGGKIVDDSFKHEIYKFLNRFRLAGYDLEINSPNYVPLDIAIDVCVKPNHYPENVKKALMDRFSTRVIQGGQTGFFHPDNFTFGQPLYLSKIYQTVMNLEGVESVFISRFQRMGKNTNMELESGVIDVHPSEIIRLDNDPSIPDNGKIEFVMKGGI